MTIAYTLLWGVITSHLLSFSVTELVSEHPSDQKVPILKQVLGQEFVYAFPHTSDSCLLEVAVLRTEQLGTLVSFRNRTAERRERLLCDKCDKAIISAFCRDLHLTLLFSGLRKHKDLFKGGWRLVNVF